MKLLLPSLLAAVRLSQAARQVGTIFTIDQASCGQYITDGTLQKFVDESANMAVAAQTIVNGVEKQNPTPYSEAYVYGFFKVMPGDANLVTIRTAVDSVQDFLVNGHIAAGNQQPVLFCNDDAFKPQNLDDQAVQLDGSPLTNPDGSPKSIRAEYQDVLSRNQGDDGQYPYVSLVQLPTNPPVYQYYFFPHSTGGSVCNSAGAGRALGETFKAQPRRAPIPVVVLCPRSFTYGATATLGNVPPEPGNQFLNDVFPQSITFLHEMFHLAPYDVTVNALDIEDVNGAQGYNLGFCLQLPAAYAISNAQSYAYLALGAWYTYNKPVGADKQERYITYADGLCEYITPVGT